MRFTTKKEPVKTYRLIRWFALLPVKVGGDTVWLEWVFLLQRYKSNPMFPEVNGWEEVCYLGTPEIDRLNLKFARAGFPGWTDTGVNSWNDPTHARAKATFFAATLGK